MHKAVGVGAPGTSFSSLREPEIRPGWMDESTSPVQSQVSSLIALVSKYESSSSARPLTPSLVLSLVRKDVPNTTTIIVLLAFTFSILQFVLSIFDLVRGGISIMFYLRSHQPSASILSSSSMDLGRGHGGLHDKNRLRRAWRPFYSLIVMVTAILQAIHLMVYLECTKGMVSYKSSRIVESCAFLSFIISIFVLMGCRTIGASGGGSPTSGRRSDATIFSEEEKEEEGFREGAGMWVLKQTCRISSALGCLISLTTLILGLRVFLKWNGRLVQGLEKLIQSPQPQGCSTKDPLCGEKALTGLLQGQVDSSQRLESFKMAVLALACSSVILTSFWSIKNIKIRSIQLSRGNSPTGQEFRRGGEGEDHLTQNPKRGFRVLQRVGSRKSSPSSSYPNLAEEAPRGLEEEETAWEEDADPYVRDLKRQGTASSYESVATRYTFKSTGSLVKKPERSLQFGQAVDRKSGAVETDSEAEGRRETIHGIHLDTTSEEGAELQRRFGSLSSMSTPTKGEPNRKSGRSFSSLPSSSSSSSSTSFEKGSRRSKPPSYFNHYFSTGGDNEPCDDGRRAPSSKLGSSVVVIPILTDPSNLSDEGRGGGMAVSRSKSSSSPSSSQSESLHAIQSDQLSKDKRELRWECILTSLVLVMFISTSALKLVVGDEVELGQRPGLELFLTAWLSLLSNFSLLLSLACLMCRGSGSSSILREG
ncbi:hypothetical protein IE53DRAFT_370832 [Violaceomyces palustris]|uniref:Uncharacterized protein n=1 Tax=Violaceomyces palustris TaxID=1673888 RepID=A0ACD0NQX4_9BASI|nr:hypothetical protein IE53DRAFT_370832 [Violaceomyces palustris]